MWTTDESLSGVKKSPDSRGSVRCFFPQSGLMRNEEVVRRTTIVVSAPSGEPYEFQTKRDERVSDFQPVESKEDAEWFQEHSPFHYQGKR